MTTAYEYLLDTDILSDLVRNPNGKVSQQLKKVGDHRVATSVIVAAEIQYGLCKSNHPELKERISRLMEVLPVLAFEPIADQHYGDIRAYLELRGETIGPNDLLIAAHARSLGLILVTANINEFLPVPELTVENWL